LRKAWSVVRGFGLRLRDVVRARYYDFVLIHREATPIGPPWAEACILALHRRVVFDFDDAIFLRRSSESNPHIAFLKWPSKTSFTARRAWKVCVGNPWLLRWALDRNARARLVPTTVDLAYHRPRARAPGERITLGWTGSHSTAPYLDLIRPVLARLQEAFDFDLRVICDVDPGFPGQRNYRFVPWRLASEIEDLARIDIGLMPVPEGEWEMGKVGFKAIQYSAVCAVPVVSAIGSGHEVVRHGETGLVVGNSDAQWHDALATLLADPGRLEAMGRAGRDYVDTRYSVRSQQRAYEELFTDD
jgi:glycosyltransferase involved in cell wall biosynthesis